MLQLVLDSRVSKTWTDMAFLAAHIVPSGASTIYFAETQTIRAILDRSRRMVAVTIRPCGPDGPGATDRFKCHPGDRPGSPKPCLWQATGGSGSIPHGCMGTIPANRCGHP